MLRTVGQLLSEKTSRELVTADPGEAVSEAVERMNLNGVGSLLVMQDDTVMGMITERDLLFRLVFDGLRPAETLVEDVMDRTVLCVSADSDLRHCMRLMTEQRERHLPVLQDGRPIGLVSIGDIVKELVSDNDFVIEQLTRYIAGSYTDHTDYVLRQSSAAAEFHPSY